MTSKPPYKTANGIWFTSALFWERSIMLPIAERAIEPVFSLYEDRKGLINARKTFVELGDPTGYQWAMIYLGDWNHWLKLIKASWFQEAYETWLMELNNKQKAEAIARIREIAKNAPDAQALPAAKYIAERGWEKNTPGRGRPSKSEVVGALKEEVQKITVEDEDAARIGLRSIQ